MRAGAGPEGRRADDLLADMQRVGRHLAVVVDEYGGTVGIVNLPELMRALVARVDEDSSLGVSYRATPEPGGAMLLDGLMRRMSSRSCLAPGKGQVGAEGTRAA